MDSSHKSCILMYICKVGAICFINTILLYVCNNVVEDVFYHSHVAIFPWCDTVDVATFAICSTIILCSYINFRCELISCRCNLIIWCKLISMEQSILCVSLLVGGCNLISWCKLISMEPLILCVSLLV
jgi:hypothetical protein